MVHAAAARAVALLERDAPQLTEPASGQYIPQQRSRRVEPPLVANSERVRRKFRDQILMVAARGSEGLFTQHRDPALPKQLEIIATCFHRNC